MIRTRRSVETQSTEDSFVVCISDLIAGLLSVFILALIFYMLNYSQVTAQLTSNNETREAILKDIKSEMEKNKNMHGIITVDEGKGVLSLSEGVLFDSARADLKPRAKNEVIPLLARVFETVLSKPEYEGTVETIFVEGHTDNAPIRNSRRFASNWELSTQRAINTWTVLRTSNPKLDTLENKNYEPLFSCSGYAETRPVTDNTTAEGRMKNRRIAFRFTMTPPTKDDAPIIKTITKELKEKR